MNIGCSWRVVSVFFLLTVNVVFLCVLSSQTEVSWRFGVRVLLEQERQSEVDYSRGESGVFVLTG